MLLESSSTKKTFGAIALVVPVTIGEVERSAVAASTGSATIAVTATAEMVRKNRRTRMGNPLLKGQRMPGRSERYCGVR